MEPTGPFGPFEIVRELDSGTGATVYKAKKEGDSKGEYVLKIFSLERQIPDETRREDPELEPLFEDLSGSFTNLVNLQKSAAQSAPWFAPILAAGHDERGAWYATHFYARSIKGMLERFVALEAGDLFHIIDSVVKAALHLKRASNRSHGNLKPSNIFIEGLRKPKSSRVLVSDPLPGSSNDAASYEQADLKSIGELIYQLVIKRKVDFASGWIILPLEETREWTQLFGKQAAGWLRLCNRLLDPNRPQEQPNLEELEAELQKLKPKAPLALKLAPVAAVLLLAAGAGAYFFLQWSKYGHLSIVTYPPGARLKVSPEGEGEENTYTTPAAEGKPLVLKLDKGKYDLSVTYTGLVASGELTVEVKAHSTLSTNLSLNYGGLVVSSEPPGAQFEFKGKTLTTPYTNLYLRPQAEPFEIRLQRDEYETTNLSATIPRDRSVLMVSAALRKPPPGSGLVTITSDPPGAEILLDGASIGTAPLSKSMEGGTSHTVLAHLTRFEDRPVSVQAIPNKTVTLPIYFPHGTLTVTNTEPPNLQIFVNDALAGLAPTNIFLPPGPSYAIRFRADGYETNNETIAITEKTETVRNPQLKARGGFIEFDTDLAGIEIRDQTNHLWGVSTANGLNQVNLPPGTYELKAIFPGLPEIDLPNVVIKAGKPTPVSINVQYAKVVFSDIEPSEARDGATIFKGTTAVKSGETIYQPSGLNVPYHVEAPGYDAFPTNIWLALKQTRQVSVALTRSKVPFKLVSLPPGATFYDIDGNQLNPSNDVVSLPWGPMRFVASYARLGSLTNDANLTFKNANPDVKFVFSYGTLALTNLPDDITVYEGADKVGAATMGQVFERPGTHAYSLRYSSAPDKEVTNFTLIINPGGVHSFPSIGPPELHNSIDMSLVWVDKLPGITTAKGGWVGKYEVSQKEYQAVMPDNPSINKLDGNFPVDNVTWQQAMDFCQKLTALDKQKGGARGDYALPTQEQWLFMEKGTQAKDAVVKSALPARVGTKAANKLGLYDIWGNVAEWLKDNNGKEVRYVGAAYTYYRLTTPDTFETPEGRDPIFHYKNVGFRVILIPSAAATASNK